MSNQATPERIMAAMTAYQQTAALRAAIDLELFSLIAAGVDSTAAIAEHVDAAERGIRALANHLVAAGHLELVAGRYRLTPASRRFLDRASPDYLGGAIAFLDSDTLRASFDSLTDAVRRGGSAASEEGTTSEGNPVWVEFARAMEPLARPLARLVAEHLMADGRPLASVLDVAAGHGFYGIEVARRCPTALVHGLDWAGVLEVARENAAGEGVGARYRTLAGSAFEIDWGGPHDLVLAPHILHHFDRAACVALLRRAHESLAPRGRLAVLEIVPNADRVAPPGPASFALVMIATTPAGDAYTLDEYRAMFAESGFSRVDVQPIANGDHLLLVTERS